jgi:beta-lactamase superfamily II metal-dependent hydrolase
MKMFWTLAAALMLTATGAAQSSKTLDIYIADTEGGKAALYVSPSGETLMIDSGNPGGRDTDRIMAMLGDAGVKRIDYLVSTHYHSDHVGGMAELAKRVPIGHYVDHGPNVENRPQGKDFATAYAELQSKAKHTVVKPGDRVPVSGFEFRIVTAGGQALKKPLPGGGQPNPLCAQFQKKEEPTTPDENAQSVGAVISFGQFRVLDLGDLLWNKEFELVCPNNQVGTVDVYMVTHHGLDRSGPEVLVHGTRPRVAIMQNGTRKGGAVPAFQIMRSSPGLEDIWQLHWSYQGGIEHNSAGVFIANVDDPAVIANVLTAPPGQRGGNAPASAGAGQAAAAQGPVSQPGHSPAYYLKVSAREDGSFTVTNTRNKFSKTYPRRRTT